MKSKRKRKQYVCIRLMTIRHYLYFSNTVFIETTIPVLFGSNLSQLSKQRRHPDHAQIHLDSLVFKHDEDRRYKIIWLILLAKNTFPNHKPNASDTIFIYISPCYQIFLKNESAIAIAIFLSNGFKYFNEISSRFFFILMLKFLIS